MKTILFFDRCDLTRLYILLTKELEAEFNIVHVAYSQNEEKLLQSAGIDKYINYQDEISSIVDNLKVSHELMSEIDQFIYQQSDGRFTMNGSIQSDRGYAVLSYDESLKAACCHYLVWEQIFSKYKVDLMYHEPCSMFMTHIAALLCKKQGGIYRYNVQQNLDNIYYYLNIDGENYDCKELKNRYEFYSENHNKIDIDRCKAFLTKYRGNYDISLGGVINEKSSMWKLMGKAIKNKMIYLWNRNKFDKIKSTIDYWSLRNNMPIQKISNLLEYKKKHIKFHDNITKKEKYYYYSIHLEPEATVLYLGEGGIYENQIKLIENIAASLPAGYYLYVKDHPHEYAYRSAYDYERLQKIPNIRLINQGISGKYLIKNCEGVFSINGTAGFEGLLFGKQVFCFGNSYYSFQKRVNYVKNIQCIKDIVYKDRNKVYDDDLDLYAYVNAYLDSIHFGFISYFGNRPEKSGIDLDLNAKKIALDIRTELNHGKS